MLYKSKTNKNLPQFCFRAFENFANSQHRGSSAQCDDAMR